VAVFVVILILMLTLFGKKNVSRGMAYKASTI
jgi:hypothetical protein